MKFGSLFSGIGGFDLGFERVGMTCAWQCEIDPRASKRLAYHWPNVRRETDVRQIGKHNLEPVDLICGGFPCQDLSVAGNRAGLAGGRSGLWWEFHRVLSELLPRWVVIENVPGLLSSDKGRDMGLLLGALAQLGYGWAYRVLDAQYFGVAQRRRRVFIVGCLGDWRGAAQVLFEPESGRRDTPPRRKAGQSFAFSAGQGAKAGSIGWHNEQFPTLNDFGSETFLASWDKAQITSREHRSRPSEISQPLNTASQMMVGVRRLTPLECERLQGFPDGWTDGQADTQRYKQLGNAVAVPVLTWLGLRLLRENKNPRPCDRG